MMRVSVFVVVAIAIGLAVAGCGAALPGSEMEGGTPSGVVGETPAAQEKEPPTGDRQPAEEPTVPAEAQNLVDLAKGDLAQAVEAEREAITVLSVEARDFADASLGVPEPDKMYAQVITPGYVIQLSVGDEVYTYHGSGERVVRVPED
jgi:hypothetical protein